MKQILLIGVARWGVNHLRVLKSLLIELFAADHDRQRLGSVDIPQNPLGLNYEIVITDDHSTDNLWSVLKQLAATDPRLRVDRSRFNCGESAASWAGMQASRGRYIATLDGDLQNDPKDLPSLLEALKNADCVCGTRTATRGNGDK
jgi:glycosyltransferase involved in cell wall biosynthesis